MAFNSIFRVILSSTFMVASSQSHILAELANRYLDGKLPVDFFKSKTNEFLTSALLSADTTIQNYVSNEEYDNVPLLTSEGVLIFPIVGTIMKNDYCGSVGTSTMRAWLSQAKQDASVKKVLFYVDSGGGQVLGTWEFAQDIANFNKPKEAFIDGYCCSGAYYLMAPCDKITSSSPDNIVGSIGVAYLYKDRTAQLASLGINDRYIYSETSPNKHGDLRGLMQGDETVLQENQLKPTDKTFMGFVAKVRPQVSEEALGGLEVVAGKALEDNTGLIDAIDSFENVYTDFSKVKTPKNNNSMAQVKLLVDSGLTASIAKLIPSAKVLTPEDEAEEIRTAQASIDKLTQEKGDLTQTVQAHLESIQTLNASLQEKDNTVSSLNTKVSNLESTVSEKDVTIADLQSKLAVFTNPANPQGPTIETNPIVDTAGQPINAKTAFVKKPLDTKNVAFVD